MTKHWFCNNGHKIIQEPFPSMGLGPYPITINLGSGAKSGELCPFCLLDWVDENLPRMWEVIKEE